MLGQRKMGKVGGLGLRKRGRPRLQHPTLEPTTTARGCCWCCGLGCPWASMPPQLLLTMWLVSFVARVWRAACRARVGWWRVHVASTRRGARQAA